MYHQQPKLFDLQVPHFVQQPFSVPFAPEYPSFVVPIGDIFNNQAVSKNGAIANFDGQGSSFDGQYLPRESWIFDGINVRNHVNLLRKHSPQSQV